MYDECISCTFLLIIPQVLGNGYNLMHFPVLDDKLVNVFL